MRIPEPAAGAGSPPARSVVASAEMGAIDSMSGDVIAVAQDERTAGFTERFPKWGDVEDAFKFWGEGLELFMVQADRVKE